MKEVILGPGEINHYALDPDAVQVSLPKEVERQGRKFTEIKYSCQVSPLERAVSFIKALALTVFTAFFALFSETTRELWSKGIFGSETIFVLMEKAKTKSSSTSSGSDSTESDNTSTESDKINPDFDISSLSESRKAPDFTLLNEVIEELKTGERDAYWVLEQGERCMENEDTLLHAFQVFARVKEIAPTQYERHINDRNNEIAALKKNIERIKNDNKPIREDKQQPIEYLEGRVKKLEGIIKVMRTI